MTLADSCKQNLHREYRELQGRYYVILRLRQDLSKRLRWHLVTSSAITTNVKICFD